MPDRNSKPGLERAAQSELGWALAKAGNPETLARDVALEVAKSRARRRRTLVAGAAMAVVALLGGTLLRREDEARSGIPRTVVVSAPEVRTLSDGSRVELRPGATVGESYSRDQRRLVLTAGEAHFQVAKDTTRPFVVAADGVEVRALGTAFAIQVGAEKVEIVVTEGKVAVSDPSGGGALALQAGERAQLSKRSPAPLSAAAIAPAEIRERLSWRIPHLEFNRTPLAEAIPLFNRYADKKLELADSSLGSLEVSGAVRADDVESLLLLLRTEFSIGARHREGSIELRR